MSTPLITAIGLAAGFHAALYGAYKDSPHESFLMRRFVRELAIATAAALVLALLGVAEGETPFVLYVSVFALSRIATEFWKLFVRVEPQVDFRIPTQFHGMGRVIHDPLVRLLWGIGFLASIYWLGRLFGFLTEGSPAWVQGLVSGGGIGLALASCGAYKDGIIEGFYLRKFLKSPIFGALAGLIASVHTASPAFLLLCAIGGERMFNELLFKILVRGYVPGKFRSMTGPFQAWMSRRRYFLPPYAMTWALGVALFFAM
jgi:hypothetical protein